MEEKTCWDDGELSWENMLQIIGREDYQGFPPEQAAEPVHYVQDRN